MKTIVTIENAKRILEAMKENKYETYGIRGDDRLMSRGDLFGDSRDWDFENDVQSETKHLDGTSTIGISSNLWFLDGEGFEEEEKEDIEEIMKALEISNHYTYNYFYLAVGNGYSYGDDPSEVVIENAEVCIMLEEI